MSSDIHSRLRKSQKLSRKIKRSIWHRYLWIRSLTGWCRILPTFIIVGTQKGGTTSLYNYLIKHPQISPAIEKELRFFDYKFHKGVNWYRGHFPLILPKKILEITNKIQFITGEASPNYIFDPRAPYRIADVIPTVKLIFLFRNPIDRAYSSYQMAVRRGREKLSFKEAILAEPSRIERDESMLTLNERYVDLDRHWFGYLSRGCYINQIKPWINLFPKKQLLFIKSEDFFQDPSLVISTVFSFLGVNPYHHRSYDIYNYGGKYNEMDPEIRKELQDYYAPYNLQLYELIDHNYMWQ